MEYRIYKYLIPFALLLFLSCNRQNREVGLLDECSVIATKNLTASGDTVIVCDIASVKESMIIPLSKLIDSLEIIRLESIDTAMINPMVIDITDNYIGINSYLSYKLFTRLGKYLCDIGHRGQGPGEHTYLYDSQIDEENKRIYLLPWAAKNIFVYDLGGNFVRNIPLPYLVHKGILNLDTEQQHISIVQLPFGEGNQPLAWTQDFEGRIIHESKLKYLDLCPDYSNEVKTQKVDKNRRLADFYLYDCVPRIDSLYYYDALENRCIPRFTVKFPSDEVPRHVYYEFLNYYMVEIINRDPYTWVVNKRLIVNKSTLEGGQFKIIIDELGGIPLNENPLDASRFDRFIWCVEPGKLQTMIDEQLSHKESMAPKDVSRLVDFSNSISENDNNYILLGKWK